MNPIHFARCVLVSCLAISASWGQAVTQEAQLPALRPPKLAARGLITPPVRAGWPVWPAISDPGGAGSLPSGARAAGGPDGAGSLPNSPASSCPTPASSTARADDPEGALPDGGPSGGELARQPEATADPGGTGGIPKGAAPPPSSASLVGGDGVGSLPVHSPTPRLAVGGNGTGGIRASLTPDSLPGPAPSPTSKPIVGRIMDASTRAPVAGALLVVINPSGAVAALAITDDAGLFIAFIEPMSGFELTIPSEATSSFPIEAGDVLTIVVP